jgi:phenylalanyl-tRNA synthetase beta chain
MEYSLKTLNKNSKLNSLTLNEIINQLNLIGFEVDDVFNEKEINNQLLDNIRLLIKLPADREDLLNEKLFLIELSTILVFQLSTIWESVKKDYSFLLKQKYSTYLNYKIYETTEDFLEILIFNIELKNFKSVSSPLWVQTKLLNAGIQPLKNIDDFITLVNLEWGQNFNTFLIGNNETKENILPFFLKKTSSTEEYKDIFNKLFLLEAGNIGILNNQKQLINVFGQINSLSSFFPISNSKIFLQGAFYNNQKDLEAITQYQKKISLRYFRKIFLEMFKFSFQRLLTLLEINSSIEIDPMISLIKGKNIELKENKILKLRKKLFHSFLNLENYDKQIFNSKGIHIICETRKDLYFSIPHFRKDLTREIDLIEEYSRFIGYKNFDEILPVQKQTLNKKRNNTNFIKQYFLNIGFNEIISNPLLDFKKEEYNSIVLTNPLNIEFTNLRTTSLFKLIDIFENNFKASFFNRRFFEIGRVFKKKNNKIIEIDTISGIFEIERLKKSKIPNIEWFLAKALLENFLKLFDYNDLKIEKNTKNLNLFHPGKSMIIKSENFSLGTFGELNPNLEIVQNSKYAIYMFELNLNFFKNWKMKKKIKTYTELSKYLPVVKDLSMIINKNIDFSLLKEVLKSSSIYLKSFEFFDIYFDENINEKIKIGIRFEFESTLMTFTTEIIEEEIDKIKQILIKNFNIIIQ